MTESLSETYPIFQICKRKATCEEERKVRLRLRLVGVEKIQHYTARCLDIKIASVQSDY